LTGILTNKKKSIDGITYGFYVGDMLYSSIKIPKEWSE
jgi:hypothetical protein